MSMLAVSLADVVVLLPMPCCAVLCCFAQVVEAALGLLPFHEKTITTPTGGFDVHLGLLTLAHCVMPQLWSFCDACQLLR
jgi:hypothetical protein